MKTIILSRLTHTWLIDVDGTIFKHNGHKNGDDELLPGVQEFWSNIPQGDYIILLSARKEEEYPCALKMFRQHGLRFNKVIFGLPAGERVLINDQKPAGLITAIAVNVIRDEGLADIKLISNPDL